MDLIVEPMSESSPVAVTRTATAPFVRAGDAARPVTFGPPFGMLRVTDAVGPQLPAASCART